MKGINRVVFAVKDIERYSKLFTELLGGEFIDLGVVEFLEMRVMMNWEAGIELNSPVSDDSELAKLIREKGEGVTNVTFNVDDVDKTGSKIDSLGFSVMHRFELEDPMTKPFMDMLGPFNKFREIIFESEDFLPEMHFCVADIELKK